MQPAVLPGAQIVRTAPDLSLTRRDGARRELMRLEIACEELDHGQGQRREHGLPPEQFYLLTRSGHRLVEPHEPPNVGQRQDG